MHIPGSNALAPELKSDISTLSGEKSPAVRAESTTSESAELGHLKPNHNVSEQKQLWL